MIVEPRDGAVVADFVFVHGLGGGSRTTWSNKTPGATIFWPEEWLSRDPDFKGVRIHTFGYNATWATWHKNPFDIHAFGESLLEELHGSPTINHSRTPIVLIGHSTGGLVIKKTCIVAKTGDVFRDIADRLHSFYFLGTPHRGSSQAKTLSNILTATGMGRRRLITGLDRVSDLVQTLNNDFRLHYQGINLHTFYESLPVAQLGIIVDYESATLGYAEERSQYLNADHVHLTKFHHPSDTNYRSLRNRLAATVSEIRSSVHGPGLLMTSTNERSPFDAPVGQLERIKAYLKIEQYVDDTLSALDDARLPGSCGWLTERREFQEWQTSSTHRYFWLKGPPACGKSMLASHVVNYLRGTPTCSYFFKSSEKIAPEFSKFLQSMAYQMAEVSPGAREALLKSSDQETPLDLRDHRSLWHNLFTSCIFHKGFHGTHYWVVDALDEAVDGRTLDEYFALLSKVDVAIPLKVFITSRPSNSLDNLFNRLSTVTIQIKPEDCQADIQEYVKSFSKSLPVNGPKAREALVARIVEKARGSFLWTVLVIKQLHEVNTEEEIHKVLDDVPEEMSKLYLRNIRKLESANSKKLAKHIITWAVCAVRPLTLDQMKEAIQLSLNRTISRDLRSSLQFLCGQFLDVDKHSNVQVVHETARAFLTDSYLKSELRIDPPEGHLIIAKACLTYLLSDDMKYSKRVQSAVSTKPTREPIGAYACLYFSSHLSKASSSAPELFDMLQRFFETNVLSWIEHVTRLNHLDSLVHAARHLSNYLRRRAKHVPVSLGDLNAWSKDLPRIVTQFGVSIKSNPASIHTLVPPFCPRKSAIFKQFGSAQDSIEVVGASSDVWNDRICATTYHDNSAVAVVSQDQHFAVALNDGTMRVYRATTCEELRSFSQGEHIRHVQFGTTSKLLATSGLRSVKLWDALTGTERFTIRMESPVLALALNEEGTQLVAATADHCISIWRTMDGSLERKTTWTDALADADRTKIPRNPGAIQISTPQQVMSVVYRSRPVQLWSLEEHLPIRFIGSCVRRTTHKHGHAAPHLINQAIVNPNPAHPRLIVAYWDDTVILYDIFTCNPLISVPASLEKLAVSPNGKTLAGSKANGSITIFDFDTLQAIHHINCNADPVADLTFTSDNLRILDVRNNQANLWEPSVLVRQDTEHNISAPSESVSGLSEDAESPGVDQTASITALRCCSRSGVAFCGRANGCVDFCHLANPIATMRTLYRQRGSFTGINDLDWAPDARILVSADSSGHFRVSRVSEGTWEAVALMEGQHQHGDPITQVLISAGGVQVLVSSPGYDAVWSVPSRQRLVVLPCPRREVWRWFNSPVDSSQLLLFQGHSVGLFHWADLKGAGAQGGSSILLTRPGLNSYIDPDDVCITRETGQLIFAERVSPSQLSLSLHGTTITKFYVHDLLPSRDSTHGGNGELGSRHLAEIPDVDHILDIVDFHGSPHILFLSRKGWICSLKLTGSASADTFQQHFFIPSVWRATTPVLLSGVQPDGDICFVYGDGIVVVRNGLTTENTFRVSIL